MLLEHDGLDSLGTKEGDWKEANVCLDEERIASEHVESSYTYKVGEVIQCGTRTWIGTEDTDLSLLGSQAVEGEEGDMDSTFGEFRDALITHYAHKKARREVMWLVTKAERAK